LICFCFQFNYVQSHVCNNIYRLTFYILIDVIYINLPCRDPLRLLSSGQIEPTFRCSRPIFWLHSQKSTRRNTPFCCRLIIVDNKRKIVRFRCAKHVRVARGHHYEINYNKYEINNGNNNNNFINIWVHLMLILYSRFFKYLLKIYTVIKIYNQDRNKFKFRKSLYVDNVLIRRYSIANINFT